MKTFWPVYCAVAAVGIATVWVTAPRIRGSLSEGARDLICQQVRNVKHLFGAPAPAPAPAAVAIAPEEAEEPAPAPVVGQPAPVASRPASRPVAAVKAAKSAVAAVKQASAEVNLPPEEEEDELPSLKGIIQADPGKATWGVVHHVAAIRNLSDGGSAGTVAGGKILLIEQHQRGASGFELIGNFTPGQREEPVIMSSEDVYCFSGDYEKLSARQKIALSSYYRLRGDAETLKARLLTENGSKSPFFADAVAVSREWRKQAKKAEELEAELRACQPSEQYKIQTRLAQMKNELSVLNLKRSKLSGQHKDWKAAHASEMSDPDADPQYLALLAQMKGFAAAIPGMAY